MDYTDFIHNITWKDLPEEVKAQSILCVRDILATAAGASTLPNAKKIRSLAAEQYGGGKCLLWFQGIHTSMTGAAFGNAFLVDSLDGHDGFRPTKGHIGATVVPTILSACGDDNISGEEFLTAIVVGYEIACRAGLAVHKNYAPAYHSSGAWASLGAAAAAARITGVSPEKIDAVIGIAEYYSAMSPMMRCIDKPASVKDGAAVGAWAAATAIQMAKHGLSGPPSIFNAEKAGQDAIKSLGEEWLILKQYFKPYPTCRWSHPAIEAVLQLQKEHNIDINQIDEITAGLFENGTHLMYFPPKDSDEAQYSLPWAIAAMLVDGELGIRQVRSERLDNPAILALGRKIRCEIDAEIENEFPEQCLSRVEIRLKDGRVLKSGKHKARGDYDNPLSREELAQKARRFFAEGMGEDRAMDLMQLLDNFQKNSTDELLALL